MKPYKGLIANLKHDGQTVYCVFDKPTDFGWLVRTFIEGKVKVLPVTADDVFPCRYKHDNSFDKLIHQMVGVWPEEKQKTLHFAKPKKVDTTPVIIGKADTKPE